MPKKGENFEAITNFEKILKETLGEVSGKTDDQEIEKLVERFLICWDCDQQEKDSHFSQINPGFQPNNDLEKCSQRLHHLSDNQKKLMKKNPSDLNAFLRDGIKKFPKKPFKEIRKDLKPGVQIFLYRKNAISYLYPYAHVVVYVGKDEDEKQKVVHLTKASWILNSSIKKEDMDQVIKDEDEVFFGHEIPGFYHSINIRQKVIARANACAEEPPLLFDYDYTVHI